MTRPKADLLQGTLDLLVLKALSLGPLHGYGIIQRIRQLSDELLEVEQGSLYPAVYRIEQRGCAPCFGAKASCGTLKKNCASTSRWRRR